MTPDDIQVHHDARPTEGFLVVCCGCTHTAEPSDFMERDEPNDWVEFRCPNCKATWDYYVF